MRDADGQHRTYPTLDSLLGAIADWVNEHREKTHAFGRCGPDEVKQVAGELGISAGELRDMVKRGPHAADQLEKMLSALGIDVARVRKATLRDMQRLCSACRHKGRCERELAKGTAAAHFDEYCPNAFTLEALLESKHLPFEH